MAKSSLQTRQSTAAIAAAGTTAKVQAPAPALAPTPAEQPQVAVQHKVSGVAAAGPLYAIGKLVPVAVNSHRGYAQAVAQHLASTGNGTFTLAALRAALVANPLPAAHPCATVQAPKGGWAKHNMPTWAAAQGWWVQAK